MEADVFPHLVQGSGGRPVAGKPHAGKYRELTLLRQRGGRGSPSPLPSALPQHRLTLLWQKLFNLEVGAFSYEQCRRQVRSLV